MNAIALFIIFIVMLLLSVPIAISLGIASMAFILFFSPLPVDMIVQSYFSGLDSFTLLAVPFFILCGDLMLEGGISKRLIDFVSSLMGKSIGALAKITVVASAIFAAISGSGPATVACIGGIMMPAMERQNYDRTFSASIASAAGALGPLIPPSLSMIMYGIIANQSITDLFIAGIAPGIVLAIILAVFSHVVAKRKKYGTMDALFEDPKQTHNEIIVPEKVSFGRSLIKAIWALLVPIIILGGIYGGIFTPTEAAIIAADYAIIIGLFVYKELKIKDIPKVCAKSALTSATCLVLVATATAFGRLLTMEQIPDHIAQVVISISSNKYILLLLINVLLLIVGMFMETLAAIIILTPIFLPIVTAVGVDPIHFGLIMVMNLVIGQCTPPVGVNTFVACRISGVRMEQMFKWLYACIAMMIIALLICTFIPQITLFLPHLIRG